MPTETVCNRCNETPAEVSALGNGLSTRLAAELGAFTEETLEARINQLRQLEIIADGVTYRNVRLVRCFPLSAEGQYIGVLDEKRREVGIIEDLNKCRPEVQRLLQEVLNDTYLVPEITRINSITSKGFTPEWSVETDRGPRVFQLRSHREVFALGNRVIIADADGNRYEIPDYTKLDKRSQRLIEREL